MVGVPSLSQNPKLFTQGSTEDVPLRRSQWSNFGQLPIHYNGYIDRAQVAGMTKKKTGEEGVRGPSVMLFPLPPRDPRKRQIRDTYVDRQERLPGKTEGRAQPWVYN